MTRLAVVAEMKTVKARDRVVSFMLKVLKSCVMSFRNCTCKIECGDVVVVVVVVGEQMRRVRPLYIDISQFHTQKLLGEESDVEMNRMLNQSDDETFADRLAVRCNFIEIILVCNLVRTPQARMETIDLFQGSVIRLL